MTSNTRSFLFLIFFIVPGFLISCANQQRKPDSLMPRYESESRTPSSMGQILVDGVRSCSQQYIPSAQNLGIHYETVDGWVRLGSIVGGGSYFSPILLDGACSDQELQVNPQTAELKCRNRIVGKIQGPFKEIRGFTGRFAYASLVPEVSLLVTGSCKQNLRGRIDFTNHAANAVSSEKTDARAPSSTNCYALETQTDLTIAYYASSQKQTLINGGLIQGTEKKMVCLLTSELSSGSVIPAGTRFVGSFHLGGLGRPFFYANGVQMTCHEEGWDDDSFIDWPSPVKTINQAMAGKFYLDACLPYDRR